MKKICILMTVLLLLGTVCAAVPASAATDDNYYHGELSSSRYFPRLEADRDYDQYRLPSMVVTQKGTVIVYGEARYLDRTNDSLGGDDNGDLCEMDLFIRRSTDGGRTFGDRIWIAKGADYLRKGYGETINNPVMFVGNDGKLHLLFCCNVGQGGLWYCRSDDDGVTWTTPVNKISQVGGPARTMMGCGPGHGICLEDGTLVVTAWTLGGDAGYSVYPLYSKDNGETWKFGTRASSNKDESCIVELSDGSVMINSRQFTGAYNSSYDSRPASEGDACRRVTVSPNGIDNWSSTRADRTLIDPACQGSMVKVDLEGLPHAILFINNASTTKRDHLTVRCSFDDGATWSGELLIDETAGGYSDIAVDANGKVYVIYENNAGARVKLVTFSFYDVFCKGNKTLSTYQNQFDAPYGLANTVEGVKLEKAENNAVKASVKDTFKASFELDITGVTRLLNADKTPVLAMRLKANTASDAKKVKVGVYLRSGSKSESVNSLYATATLPNDGQYHTVLFDMSGKEAFSGNLYSFELILTPVGHEVAVGDSFELASFGFYENIDAAKVAYPEDSGNNTQDTQNSTDSGNSTEQEGGCKSVMGASGAVLALMIGTGVVLKKKRRI